MLLQSRSLLGQCSLAARQRSTVMQPAASRSATYWGTTNWTSTATGSTSCWTPEKPWMQKGISGQQCPLEKIPLVLEVFLPNRQIHVFQRPELRLEIELVPFFDSNTLIKRNAKLPRSYSHQDLHNRAPGHAGVLQLLQVWSACFT